MSDKEARKRVEAIKKAAETHIENSVFSKKGYELFKGIDKEIVVNLMASFLVDHIGYFDLYYEKEEQPGAEERISKGEMYKLVEDVKNSDQETFVSYNTDKSKPPFKDDIIVVGKCANCGVEYHIHSETQPDHNGWISVKDRLPEKIDEYIVFGPPVTTMEWNGHKWYSDSLGELNDYLDQTSITHWMPLPIGPS